MALSISPMNLTVDESVLESVKDKPAELIGKSLNYEALPGGETSRRVEPVASESCLEFDPC